ncbi:sulfate adenylyltransferase [Halosimplex halobium]|uniref:sulfate adenylyltransferase n=1 Tax=Halosimplex halobium TaxID=3396618 RepID=UPI003F55767C
MIPPHGNTLIDRRLNEHRSKELRSEFEQLPDIQLTDNQFYDFRNIATGAYSPLRGFLSQNDFLKVINDLSLESGVPWPLPIVLDIDAELANAVDPNDRVGLRGPSGEPIGVMDVEDIYRYNVEDACEKIFQTASDEHPGVRQFKAKDPFFIGGDIKAFASVHDPPSRFNLTPVESRVLFNHNEWDSIAGFQTRNVPHRAHEYLQKSALEHSDGIFIQPKIGSKKKGDYSNEAILTAYETLVSNYYPDQTVAFGTLRSRMWYAGPREAVFDCLVRKNFGCTQFIIGRDHAGVGNYYGDFESQQIFNQLRDINIEPLFYHYAFYCEICDGIVSEKICPHDSSSRIEPSGTKLRKMLKNKESPSPKLMRPEVAETVINMDEIFIGDR